MCTDKQTDKHKCQSQYFTHLSGQVKTNNTVKMDYMPFYRLVNELMCNFITCTDQDLAASMAV